MEKEKILVDKGDRKLYDSYDKNFTGNLEQKLLKLDVAEEVKKFPETTISILKQRYFISDEDGEIKENIPQMFARVASNIAYADRAYGANEQEVYKTAKNFYQMMISADFMPNSPALMNAGRALQQLSACFVLPIEDAMESILGTMKDAGMVHKSGGGTGFSLGDMRMANDIVSSTYGLSSGPVRFLAAYDAITHAVNQGGTRRGANMGSMPVDHPDIIQFVTTKTKEGTCANFNLSVALTDDFMKKALNDEWYTLKNPKKGQLYELKKGEIEKVMKAVRIGKINLNDTNFYIDKDGKIIDNVAGLSVRINENEEVQLKAKEVFDYIVDCAWKLGEPGIIFIDEINRHNPTPNLGRIKATNPCGEQPLLPYEACDLGSINLYNFVRNGEFDRKRLKSTVRKAVHFLDNLVDMSKFPIKKITKMVHKNRKIGLGVMGWADALIKLGIPYDSEKAVELAENVMSLINETAKEESKRIAKKRGVFPAYFGSVYEGKELIRNASRTTIAPTGTIGKIARWTSEGIEPRFRVVYTHTDADGTERETIIPTFIEDLKKYGVKPKKIDKILQKLRGKKGEKGEVIEKPLKLKEIKGVSKEILDIYRTADVISVDYHIKMQAGFQKHTDNAVSKTINLPNSATREDVKKAYLLAYKLGCKGVTIYRSESRKKQVITEGVRDLETKVEEVVYVDVEIGSKAIEEADDVAYYKITKGEDTFHLTIVGEFWEDKKNKKVYSIPRKIFQNKKQLGKEDSTEFAQSGLDRTGRLKTADPDWVEMIKEWKSATGDKVRGIGPTRINSPTHGVGLAFEHYCLSRGIVAYEDKEDKNKELINVVGKPALVQIKDYERKKELKKKMFMPGNEKKVEHRIYDNIYEKFECPECHTTEFHKESGCSDLICNSCSWSAGKCD